MATLRVSLPSIFTAIFMASCHPLYPEPIEPNPEPWEDWDEDYEEDCEYWGTCDDDVEEVQPIETVPLSHWMGICQDGTVMNSEGFVDCEAHGCIETPGCCIDVGRQWIHGDFGDCDSIEACGWTTPGSGVELHESWALFSPVEAGEASLWSEPVVPLAGNSTVTFVAHLTPTGCTDVECHQAVGLVLTPQDELASSVTPTIGLYLDGEQGAAQFFVADRVVASVPMTVEELTSPTGFALQRRGDGRVAFWAGLEVSERHGRFTAVLEDVPPSYVTDRFTFDVQQRQRLVVIANVSGEGEAKVGGVTLDQGICDLPGVFDGRNNLPLVAPTAQTGRVGRPTVWQPAEEARGPNVSLLMIHEEDEQLALSWSNDRLSWERIASLSFGTPTTAYGAVARRAPSVVQVQHAPGDVQFHLYYEAESEHQGLINGDLPRYAIAHAVSLDGINWEERADSIALTGSEEHPWRREVRQPSVVTMHDGSLMMFFVGVDPETGATRLGNANMIDGATWLVDELPSMFNYVQEEYERDGVGHPTVLRRGNILHLWYTASSNGRESIVHAIGRREHLGYWIYQRVGQVLEAEATWEAGRVLAPAPIMLSPEQDDPRQAAALLHLFYEAGPVGQERIGVVTRELPARFID